MTIQSVLLLSVGTYIANSERQQTFKDFLYERIHPKHEKIYVGNFYRIHMLEWIDDNK